MATPTTPITGIFNLYHIFLLLWLEVTVVCIAAWILLLEITESMKYMLVGLQLSGIFLNHIVYSIRVDHLLRYLLYFQLAVISIYSFSVYATHNLTVVDQTLICVANVMLVYIIG